MRNNSVIPRSPRPDDLFATLAGEKSSSKLDSSKFTNSLSSNYMTADEESAKLPLHHYTIVPRYNVPLPLCALYAVREARG